MVREFRSIIAFLSSLVLAAFSVAASTVQFVHEVITFDWHLDAHTSISLDSVMHDVDRSPSTALQRAKAFLQRALLHPWWVSDHFDPGRGSPATA